MSLSRAADEGAGTKEAKETPPNGAGTQAAKPAEKAQPNSGDTDETPAPKIAGLSALRGLILYGATLTFAVLYGYFIYEIFSAASGKPPGFDATLVTSAAALAGVLGSAFALEVGTPTDEGSTNPGLHRAINAAAEADRRRPFFRQLFSLEPSDTQTPSWPKTFGIWAYAFVAAAVALTYIFNQGETPPTIKALAVAFGGYVIALINTAYGLAKQ